jgi:hypothetical protein
MVGSTLGVYSFGLIFVSARTNQRHHHHWPQDAVFRLEYLGSLVNTYCTLDLRRIQRH